jgi:hypothetical protein
MDHPIRVAVAVEVSYYSHGCASNLRR